MTSLLLSMLCVVKNPSPWVQGYPSPCTSQCCPGCPGCGALVFACAGTEPQQGLCQSCRLLEKWSGLYQEQNSLWDQTNPNQALAGLLGPLTSLKVRMFAGTSSDWAGTSKRVLLSPSPPWDAKAKGHLSAAWPRKQKPQETSRIRKPRAFMGPVPACTVAAAECCLWAMGMLGFLLARCWLLATRMQFSTCE